MSNNITIQITNISDSLFYTINQVYDANTPIVTALPMSIIPIDFEKLNIKQKFKLTEVVAGAMAVYVNYLNESANL